MTAPNGRSVRYAVVVPTVGRPSLVALLESLAAQVVDGVDAPDEVVVVDDRCDPRCELPDLPRVAGRRPVVLRAWGRGPAAARNVGWRASSAPWVVFLDDDVLLPPGWSRGLLADVTACGPRDGATQARLHVPLPPGRPTDFARGTAGLEAARWATADMAYRREALLQVAGLDERFPRAYREDADLALRVRRAGWTLRRGERVTHHPVRPSDDWFSLRVQRGNADDALMRRLHGPRWREAAQVPRGRLRQHLAVVACAGTAVAGLLAGRRRVAAAGAFGWLGLTGEFTTRRLAPGPRPGQPGWAAEWRRMLLTSPAIPFAAVAHRVLAEARWRGGAVAWPPPLQAVLFDRDGTLVHDVPYNGDPDAVRPVAGAVEAVQRCRDAGLKVAVVSNQSGIARGLVTAEQVDAVNQRVDALLGPFDSWQVCPHGPDDGCACRKPRPGLVLQAARELGVDPAGCAVVGDIGADVDAALAAGARAVLVPNGVTRQEEVTRAPVVAPTLRAAVDHLLTPSAATAHPVHGQAGSPASAGQDMHDPDDLGVRGVQDHGWVGAQR